MMTDRPAVREALTELRAATFACEDVTMAQRTLVAAVAQEVRAEYAPLVEKVRDAGDVVEFEALRIRARALHSHEAGAEMSWDGLHRYALWRVWANARPLVIIGLNPSTADATNDDPTIRRCVGFAKREGCGRLVMLNLFAFRATDPKLMLAAEDRVGHLNDAVLKRTCGAAIAVGGTVVAAWGACKGAEARAREVLDLLSNKDAPVYPLCFGRTASGAPRHPLYLKSDSPLEGL